MHTYLFVGSEPRHFPTLGLLLEPNVDADGVPTGEPVEFETEQVVSHSDVLTEDGEPTTGIDTPNNADPDPNRGLVVDAAVADAQEPIADYTLEDLSREELYELAGDLDLHGRSRMDKAELVAALREAAQQTPADVGAATDTTEPVAGEGNDITTEE